MLSILTTNLCQEVPERNQHQNPPIYYCKVLNKSPEPMAQPPAPIDYDYETILQGGDIKPRERSLLDITIDKFTTSNSKYLVYGTITGWVAGVGVVRLGKVAAFGLGGGVLLLHFACECGYVHVNWDKVRETASRSADWVDILIKFVKKNSCYSVGFVGGFFFGIAST